MSVIAALLEASSLRHAPDALSALRSGWKEGRHTPSDVGEISRIYSIRLERARRSDNAYLKDLADATAEMLDNLRTASSLTICDITGPDGRLFLVFFSPAEQRALGCLSARPNPDSAANVEWANGGGAV